MNPDFWRRGTLAVVTLYAAMISSSVQAGPVTFGTFLQFGFSEAGLPATGCDPADPLGAFCAESPGTELLDAPPWTFTAPPAGAVLTVTDVGLAGDRFEVFDHDLSIGLSSIPNDSGDCGFDPAPCLVDSNMSHAQFVLAGGAHSITLAPVSSPHFGGTGFLRIDAVPIPAAWLFALTGMAVLLGQRRSKR